MPIIAARFAALGTVCMFVVSAAGVAAAGDDWPTYQGDNGRTGVRGQILDEADVEVLWTFQTGEIDVHSTPAVVGGIVYFGAGDGGIYAVNASSGEEVWSVQTGASVRASPAVADGVVYIGAEDGKLYALDASTGDLKWATRLGTRLMATPALSDQVVVVVTWNGTVAALDRTSGTRRWSIQTEAHHETKPLVIGDLVYVGTPRGELFAIEVQTGRIEWLVDYSWDLPRSLASRDQTIYAQNAQGTVRAWDASSGDERWTTQLDSTFPRAAPTVLGRMLYVSGDDGIYQLDAVSGQLIWINAELRSADSLVATDDFVLGISSKGLVFAIAADTGETLWARDVAGFVMTAPVVVDSVMYTGTGDWRLMAIQVARNATNLEDDDSGNGGADLGKEDPRGPTDAGPETVPIALAAPLAAVIIGAIMARRSRPPHH